MRGNIKNVKEKKNMVHNYLILLLICFCFIAFVFYVCKIYTIQEEEKLKIPVIRGELLEIYKDDLDHYIMDNPSSIIYVCTADDEKCRFFEKDFKKLLKKNEYMNQIIYLNLTDVDQELFLEEFNRKYNSKTKLSGNYPAFILFEDGKIKSILQGKSSKNVSTSKLKQFLEVNEIGE